MVKMCRRMACAAHGRNEHQLFKEVVGAWQVLTEYNDSQLPLVLDMLERFEANLTAAVVSNDPIFLQKVCLGFPSSLSPLSPQKIDI